MLCEDKIIALYCIVDDLLKGIDPAEDSRRKVSDSEVITTALVSSLYGGHHDNARHFMEMTKLIPVMLGKSRFNRRLHDVSDLLFSLFYQLGHCIKTIAGAGDYVIDSFPVAVCDNIRISRSRIVKGKQ